MSVHVLTSCKCIHIASEGLRYMYTMPTGLYIKSFTWFCICEIARYTWPRTIEFGEYVRALSYKHYICGDENELNHSIKACRLYPCKSICTRVCAILYGYDTVTCWGLYHDCQ